jgi:hypothetical protein
MWWIIDVIKVSLKLVLWLYVIIFLCKIYHIACNMANSQTVLDEALAELGLEDADDKPSDACGSTAVVEHRRALIGLSQSGLPQKIGIKNTDPDLDDRRRGSKGLQRVQKTLDFINRRLRLEHQSEAVYENVDEALALYSRIYQKNRPGSKANLSRLLPTK